MFGRINGLYDQIPENGNGDTTHHIDKKVLLCQYRRKIDQDAADEGARLDTFRDDFLLS